MSFKRLKKTLKGYADGGEINPNPELTPQSPTPEINLDNLDRYSSPDSISNVYNAVSDINNGIDQYTGNQVRRAALRAMTGSPSPDSVSGEAVAKEFLQKSDPETQQKFRELGMENPINPVLGAGVEGATDWKNAVLPIAGTAKAVRFPNLGKVIISEGSDIQRVHPEEFRKYFNMARDQKPLIKEMTSELPVEGFNAWKTYLSPDKKSGFIIKPDGELAHLFSTEKGRGDQLVRTANKYGANKLDAFDGYLPKLYSKHGYAEYKRDPNWTPGGPDVVYMKRKAAQIPANVIPDTGLGKIINNK